MFVKIKRECNATKTIQLQYNFYAAELMTSWSRGRRARDHSYLAKSANYSLAVTVGRKNLTLTIHRMDVEYEY